MEEFSTYGLWFQSKVCMRYDKGKFFMICIMIFELIWALNHLLQVWWHRVPIICLLWHVRNGFFYLCCCLLVCSPYAFTYRNFVVPPYVVRAKASYCTNRLWKSGKFLFGFVGNIGKNTDQSFQKGGKTVLKTWICHYVISTVLLIQERNDKKLSLSVSQQPK